MFELLLCQLYNCAMQIKNRFLKLIFKVAVVVAVFECLYLVALPPILNKIASGEFVNNLIESKTNANLEYKNAKFKTHFYPDLSISADNLKISDKENNSKLLDIDNFKIKLSLIDLLRREINIKKLETQKLNIALDQDEQGIFNFQKLFPKKDNSKLKFKLSENDFKIKKYNITFEDNVLNNNITLSGEPLLFAINKNKQIEALTNGSFVINDKKTDFDINFKSNLPFKNITNIENIDGKFFIYNLNLNEISPYLQQYIDKNTKTLTGVIDYIQLSTIQEENTGKHVIVNTLFKDVVYDRNNWKNHITANGENSFHAKLELKDKKIKADTITYKANKVNIKADGTFGIVNKKPELDINVEVKDSRAENIAAILPPNTVPSTMIIERVKQYGVFGDVEGKVTVKGSIPNPDITGYVKGRNVHVLEKDFHKTHKGTVDLTFNKRTLDMDILVDMLEGQKATIKGYTYMFREGINNVTIKTTDNIDFPIAQKIVIPVSKVFNFMLGPIPEMNITSGKGIIDINIQGSIDYINLDGYTDFEDASLTYNGLHGQINKGAGHLDFKGDVISFKSKQAFVKTNPLSVDGKVKINDYLDFNISSEHAQADDLLEVINNSELLKDVKAGLAVITAASGPSRLFVNMKSKIVPVPYGHPPLPPEEAFEDMRVKGSIYLLGNTGYLQGFNTPIENLKGIVDFTEKTTDIHNITAVSGTSPITISGKIVNDLETKIPDVNITVTSKEVNLKDTIRFLTMSYLYPENYPNLSSLYKIASKHDLYFKYKAKSIDFVTDCAYAVMNFIPDKEENPIKAKSGKVVMENSTVTVDNVNASLFNTDLNINGNVEHVDTINPLYNLKIQTKDFDLSTLNNPEKITILPQEFKEFLLQFSDFKGFADLDIILDKNILKGKIFLKKLQMIHKQSKIPFAFDDFNIFFKDKKILVNDVAAKIAEMPFFGELILSDYTTKKPKLNGFFTSKITNDFIKTYLPEEIANKISVTGDISLSSKVTTNDNNIIIEPKLILNPEADLTSGGINVGDVNERREFTGKINFLKDKIQINDFKYIKYVSSQNNKTYPITFADANGVVNIKDDQYIPVSFKLKTNKNLPARILNVLLKSPILTQGTFNCDIEYKFDEIKKIAQIIGNMDCKNLDIPIFDTLIKNVKLNANKDNIDIKLFGFLNDSKINVDSIIRNNLAKKPQVDSINIYIDQIDRNKLFETFSNTHSAMNTNNKIKNIDLGGLSVSNGHLEVKELIVKSLVAKNFISDFCVDEKGLFTANNMTIDVGQGNLQGNMSYNLVDTTLIGDFELNNVDANYVAETLFDGKNQIYGNANGKLYLSTKGSTDVEMIKNLSGYINFNVLDGKMPKLGSLEYLLKASNIIKGGITSFTLNNVLELLNLVKTGYFSNINGSCNIENGIAKDIEIFSKGENMSLYIHGNYDITQTHAEFEILGKLSKRISTIFGKLGNTSLNTFFRMIPGVSLFNSGRKDFVKDIEKIPSFTTGDYESRVFQAIIDGNINESGYVQSFKWVE